MTNKNKEWLKLGVVMFAFVALIVKLHNYKR